jgi:hypothetical protein
VPGSSFQVGRKVGCKEEEYPQNEYILLRQKGREIVQPEGAAQTEVRRWKTVHMASLSRRERSR